jgi:hypothetical protein
VEVREKFDAGIKTASEKKYFIHVFLVRYFEIKEEKNLKRRERRHQLAIRSGERPRTRKKSKREITEKIGLTQRMVEKYAEKDPDLFGKYIKEPDEEFIVSDAKFKSRMDNFVKELDKLEKQHIPYSTIYSFEPSSKGERLPQDKDGNFANWVTHQEKIGILQKDENGEHYGPESIRWIASRYLRHIIAKGFLKIPRSGKLRFVTLTPAMITNLRNHNEIMFEPLGETPLKFYLHLKGEDYKNQLDRLEYQLTVLLIRTLYAGGEYGDHSEGSLTSSGASFRVPSVKRSSRGKRSIETKNFKLAFSLLLIKD